MKSFHHRFRVRAPLVVVADFHRSSSSMGAITPPPVIVRLHHAPTWLSEGDTMDFTLWLGPLPLHWLAGIADISPTGFSDVQMRGPFRQWRHRHEFIAVGATTTDVLDTIEAEIRSELGWRLVGLGMWLSLPLLFAFRGWKTRRILEQR